MHVFGHDQKHLHRAETLPKFKHDDFAYTLLLTDRQIQPRYAPKIQTRWFCICIITNWQTDTAEIRSQNSNNDQHNYNTIANAVVIPCISCQKRSQWAETLPKFRHNGMMYNGIENAVYVWTQTLTKSSNSRKKWFISGIENAMYMSCQKFSKGAETCPNFKHNDLAYKSIENVGYISCQKRYKDQKLLKNSNTMT